MYISLIKKLSFLLILMLAGSGHAQMNLNWIQKAEGTSASNMTTNWAEYMKPGSCIATDSKGNVIISGTTGGVTTDIQNGTGSYLLPYYGSNDIFVASYNNAGQVRWGFTLGSPVLDASMGIYTDASDNAYLTGFFKQPIDLDPGPGNFILTPGDGDQDLFIAKYDSTGAFVNAIQIVSEYVNPTAGFFYKVDFDSQQNLVVAASYSGDIDLDPGVGVVNMPVAVSLHSKSFVAKYTPALEFIDAWPFFSPTGDFLIFDLEVDADDDFYISGEYHGLTDFDPGTGDLPLTSTNHCGYIGKYSPLCEPLWVNKVWNTYQSQILEICQANDGNIIVGGLYAGELTLPLSSGDSISFHASGGNFWDQELFYASYTSAGEPRWGIHMPQSDHHQDINSIEYNASDDVFYIAFTFSGTINLDEGNSGFSLTVGNFPTYQMGVASYRNEDGSFIFGQKIVSAGINYNYLNIRNNEVFMAGDFRNTADLDLTAGVNNVTTSSTDAVFLAKYCHVPNNVDLHVGNDTLIVCEDAAFTIIPSGASRYKWYDSLGHFIAENDTLQLIADTSFRLYAEGINGTCVASVRKEVYIRVIPKINILPDSLDVCPGGAPVLQYAGVADTTASNFPGVFLFGEHIYNSGPVWLTDYSFGCISSDTAYIHVLSVPTVELTLEANSMCANDTLILTALPENGEFAGVGVSDSIFTASAAGTYEIFYAYTDTNLCIVSVSETIEVLPLPTVTFSAGSDAICANDTLLLTGSPEDGIFSGTGVSDTLFTADAAGAYEILYVYTDANLCTVSVSDTVHVFALPAVTITAESQACLNDTLSLSGSPATGIFSGTGVSGSQFAADTAGTYEVSYTYTDENLCTAVASSTVHVFPLPEVAFTAEPDTICLNDTLSLSGSPAEGIFSGTGVSGLQFTADLAGVYEIVYAYTDANLCAASASDTVHVLPLPAVSLSVGPEVICIDNTLLLSGGLPAGGIFSGTGVNNGHLFAGNAGAGMHEIFYSFTDANLCKGIASDNVDIQLCLSVDENEAGVPVVPVFDLLNQRIIITGDFDFELDYVILDSQGKKISYGSLYTGAEINIEGISSGIYLLQLSGGKAEERYFKFLR